MRQLFEISIHALREEGDRPPSCARHGSCIISIHALREEGDTSATVSTTSCAYFYPRPPRGGRPPAAAPVSSMSDFYPRPPRGGRLVPLDMQPVYLLFLSTPSARRATGKQSGRCHQQHYFYPRPPRGGRPRPQKLLPAPAGFLSTPSARRATGYTAGAADR